MTTTYELYTNENGTPKAVEGKAPAIIERVEALETNVEALETNVETLEGTLENGVVTSVNGNSGDITPEQTGCLPLKGGTMTGAIGRKGALANNIQDDSNLQINGGSGWGKGASIDLYGKDRTTDGGAFKVRAHDGTTYKDFIAKPDGTMTWGGNNVLTTANGLPLSGGTMSGTVKFSGNGSVMGSENSSSIQLYGGTAWNAGSMIGVYGKSHSTRPGWLYLSAHDGTNTKTLIGKPDGTLTWDGKDLTSGGGSASRGTIVNISSVKTYTAPSNGIIYIEGDFGGNSGSDHIYGYFYIGNTYIGNSKATRTHYTEGSGDDNPTPYYIASRAFFVNKGDVVTCKSRQNTSASYNMYFTGCFTPVTIS